MLDLEPKYVSIIQKILAEHVPNNVVWVYGSRIKGNSHEGSDLDLVIMPSQDGSSQSQLFALRNAFSESNIPILIDLLDWEMIPETFKQEIESQHEVIYQPKA